LVTQVRRATALTARKKLSIPNRLSLDMTVGANSYFSGISAGAHCSAQVESLIDDSLDGACASAAFGAAA
jgi:hypothetical protein